MRKVSFCLILMILFTFFTTPVLAASQHAPSFADQINSKSVFMIETTTGMTVYEKDADKRMQPASLAKIMTCILTLENVKDLDSETVTLKAYIEDYLYTNRINTLGGILRGETLTVRDLLYAMMLQSANEAAMMLGDYVGDSSLEYFAEMMNEKAKELGCTDTNFTNATGLSDENAYTTARDMAKIASYAMQNPTFVELVTTTSYVGGPTNMHEEIRWNTINYMQVSGTEYYHPNVKGVKTGTLDEVGRNFVSTATMNGYTYLLVTLGAPLYGADGERLPQNLSFVDALDLYEWAFDTFRVKTIIEVNEPITEIPVRLSSDKDNVKLLSGERLTALVPNEIEASGVQKQFEELPESIDAPVKKGQTVGYVKLLLAGEEIGRVPLVAAESIEMNKALYYLEKVRSFFDTFLFKFILIFVILLIVSYVLLMIVRNRNNRRYSAYRRKPPKRKF